jgi:hypothetical protein
MRLILAGLLGGCVLVGVARADGFLPCVFFTRVQLAGQGVPVPRRITGMIDCHADELTPTTINRHRVDMFLFRKGGREACRIESTTDLMTGIVTTSENSCQ